MSTWDNKPCAMCSGKKGPAYATQKYCGNCRRLAKKASADRAHRTMVARVYGMASGDYDRIYIVQRGRCPICLRATGKSRRLSVDHDHRTGEVRGLLCRTCNNILGHARDDPTYFCRAIAYLADPPARIVLNGG